MRSIDALVRTLAVAALLAAVPVSPARAESSCQAAASKPLGILSAVEGAFAGHVGDWVEYAMVENDLPLLDQTFRVQLVKGDWEGQSLVWVELWVDKTGRRAVRTTRRADGKSVVILKFNGTFFDMPTDQAEQVGGSCKPDSNATLPKKYEPVRTLAGKFSCRHVEMPSGGDKVHIWYADDVPVLRLVRLRLPGKRGYDIVARGSGGESAFPARFRTVPFPKMDALMALLPADPPKPEAPACDPSKATCEPAPAKAN